MVQLAGGARLGHEPERRVLVREQVRVDDLDGDAGLAAETPPITLPGPLQVGIWRAQRDQAQREQAQRDAAVPAVALSLRSANA